MHLKKNMKKNQKNLKKIKKNSKKRKYKNTTYL